MSLLNEMLHDLAKQKRSGPSSPLYPASMTSKPSRYSQSQIMIGAAALGGVVLALATSWVLSSSSGHVIIAQKARQDAPKQVLVSKKKKPVQRAAPRDLELVSYIAPLSAYESDWVSVDPAIDASKVALNKIYSPLTVEEWHESQLNKALKSIQQGDDDKAIRILEAIVEKVPQAVDARENLASLYLTYGDIANAREVTEEGLRYSPENSELLTIKARLLMAEERSDAAVRLLMKHRPSMKKYPDYYGTLAAALQSSGQFDKAGSLYKTLLQVEPDNGQYWLGYAIFLEHHQKINQAIDAYTRASQNPESESVVREYAENRLNHLQG